MVLFLLLEKFFKLLKRQRLKDFFKILIFASLLFSSYAHTGSSSLFFEAEKSKRDSIQNYYLEEDVLVFSSQKILTAEKVIYNEEKGEIELVGKVMGTLSDKFIFAEKLKMNLRTEFFSLERGGFVHGDPEKIKKFKKSILDLSVPDSFEEKKKSEYFEKIEKLKSFLFEKAKNLEESILEKEFLLDYYEVLLKKEGVLNKNSSLKKSKKIEKRNALWAKVSSTEKDELIPFVLEEKSYFKLDGELLTQLEEEEFEAEESRVSFCLCDENENPAWSIKSSHFFYKEKDYISLSNAILEIKSIPFFYLPYIRLPLFDGRKIGILSPKFYFSDKNGFVYSQDFYIPHSSYSDLTFNYSYLEKRGLKFEAMNRFYWSNLSFFSFSFEGIRDKRWLEEREERRFLKNVYKKGFEESYQSVLDQIELEKALEEGGLAQEEESFGEEGEPFAENLEIKETEEFYRDDWWTESPLFKECFLSEENYQACLKEGIDPSLLVPKNSFRGRVKWGGQLYVNPSLSLLSKGDFSLDHRYQNDIFDRSSEFSSILSETKGKKDYLNIIRNKARFNFGFMRMILSSSFSDPIEMPGKFSGYQTPFSFRIKHKQFPFLIARPFVAYLGLKYDLKKISLWDDEKLKPFDDKYRVRLSDAFISEGEFDFSIPFSFRSFFALRYFLTFQGKRISHSFDVVEPIKNDFMTTFSLSKDPVSYFGRYKTGFSFSLPLEGESKILELRDYSNAFEEEKVDFLLRHQMDWNIDFSYVSKAHIEGIYGNVGKSYSFDRKLKSWLNDKAGSTGLSYFQDDASYFSSERKISFSSLHFFSFAKKKISRIKKSIEKSSFPKGFSRNREKAWKALFSKELRNREKISDDRKTASEVYFDQFQFLSFSAEMSYDFEKADERVLEEKILTFQENSGEVIVGKKLTESWSPFKSVLNVNIKDFILLSFTSDYNLYLGRFSNLKFDSKISLPLSTSFLTSFSVDRVMTDFISYEDYREKELFSGSLGFSLPFSRASSLKYAFSFQTLDIEEPYSFSKKLEVLYQPPSQCWGGAFSWIQPMAAGAPLGSYTLSFFVKFAGREFSLGNLAKVFEDEKV